MTDSLSITVHAIANRVLMSFSVASEGGELVH